MDDVIAKALVGSLVGRLIELPDGFRLPEGIISRDEVNALRHLSGQEEYIGTTSTHSDQSDVRDHKLNLDAVEHSGPQETLLRICLDFGTALSKAWAIGEEVHETIPLVLGRYCDLGEVLAVPSSIFISENGRLFFGGAAETQHRQEIEHGRKRFDNLKRMLSDAEVKQELDHVTLPKGIDPTSSGLTRGNLLVLYLAWITDLTHRALNNLRDNGGIPLDVSEIELRSVRRRFAIPCFSEAKDSFTGSNARSEWAEDVLTRAILRAQVVADTLRNEWDSLDTFRAKAVVDAVGNMERSALPSVLAVVPSVREPIAAGASLFDEELDEFEEHDGVEGLSRRYLMVVDAGAGTTDFAVFQVFSRSEEARHRYALLSGSVRMSRVAGNAVDEVLQPLILQACGIDPATGAPRNDEAFGLIKTDLSAQIRSIKEALFIDGTCDVELHPNAKGTVTRVDLETHPAYASLAEELNSQCKTVLDGLFPAEYADLLRRSGYRVPVHVLLTGGSSKLPIVEAIAGTSMTVDGIIFELKRVRSTPEWINGLSRVLAELVGRTFPQSAVSIGGAAPELPTELPAFPEPIVPPLGGKRTLEKFPTRGI